MPKPERYTTKKISVEIDDYEDLSQLVLAVEARMGRKVELEEIFMEPDGYFDSDHCWAVLSVEDEPVENLNYDQEMLEYEKHCKIQEAQKAITDTSPSVLAELQKALDEAQQKRQEAIKTLEELEGISHYHNLAGDTNEKTS